MATVVIAGRQLDRQIDQSQFFIDRNLPPDTRIAGVFPGFVFPSLITVLVRQRYRVKDPETLAGADIEPAYVTLHILHALRISTGSVRGANDDHVLGDGWCRVKPDFARDEVDFLIVIELQINNGVV